MKRVVLLKLSGEVLFQAGRAGYSRKAIRASGKQIAAVHQEGRYAQVVVIGGGGNIRGAEAQQELRLKDRVACDQAGMLATLQNAIIFQQFLEEKFGLDVRVVTAMRCDGVAEPYIRRRVLRHLAKGRIVILAGGLGEPGFSTDTTMVKRGLELGAKIIAKGTKVDGVYTMDPVKFPQKAKYLAQVNATNFLRLRLKIVDSTAVTMLRDAAKVPLHVFDYFNPQNYRRLLAGKKVGSLIVP